MCVTILKHPGTEMRKQQADHLSFALFLYRESPRLVDVLLKLCRQLLEVDTLSGVVLAERER